MRTKMVCFLVLVACGAPVQRQEPVKNSVEKTAALPFVPKAQAPAVASIDETKICSSTRECVLLDGACGKRAINKFETANAPEDSRSCGWEKHIAQSFEPQCHAGMCRATTNIKACGSEVDCVVVAGNCDVLEVVNQKFSEPLASAISASLANRRCAEPSYPPVAVGCLGGQCVGVEKEQAGLRRGCATEADCALVRGLCGQPMAVNVKHQERTEAYFAKKNATVSCPAGSAPKTRLRCDNGYCVAALAAP